METNETMVSREVVVIDLHKKIGTVKGLLVNCDTMAVSHYIVNNAGTASVLLLPFKKAIAVGDTFMTVQNREDFLAANDPENNILLQSGYKLLNEDVFAKTGNRLGTVKSFEFDTVYGTITRIDLDSASSYANDAFIFFSPEFIFVDDGSATAEQLRQSNQNGSATAQVFAPEPATYGTAGVTVASTEPAEATSGVQESAAGFEESQGDMSEEASISEDEISEFLVGNTLSEDVVSEDGAFKASKGTVITKELIEEAKEYDALLLLTISIDV